MYTEESHAPPLAQTASPEKKKNYTRRCDLQSDVLGYHRLHLLDSQPHRYRLLGQSQHRLLLAEKCTGVGRPLSEGRPHVRLDETVPKTARQADLAPAGALRRG